MILQALCVLPLLFQTTDDIVFRRVLAVERLGEKTRSPVYTDGMEILLAVDGDVLPIEGEAIGIAGGGERQWRMFSADEKGWFKGAPFRGGWAYADIDVPQSGAWRLDARGHTHVLVDGVSHYGDPYSLGLTRIPLALEAGEHRFLFRCGRGELRAELQPAPAAVYFEEKDRTLPDVLLGETETLWAGILVANAGLRPIDGYRVVARGADGSECASVLPRIYPSSFQKCKIGLAAPEGLAEEAGSFSVTLDLFDADGKIRHTLTLELGVRSPRQKHVRTFVSQIDGSVQYFAVTPPEKEPAGTPALFLSLHGAGVEGRRQAECYRPRDWGVLVAPTNRRQFGFDWEDWGRLDALEVLELAQERFGTDPRRTYLTGHSMGGHGTWQLGAHFPDRFAAIAPSAGWRDFWGYGGAGAFPEDDPIGAHLTRATNASRTLLLERNYLQSGIYILHGDNDQTVSVQEARAMREKLAAFHPNFAYYERPGAGHWWGNACMDWPPLFEFLKQNTLPDPRSVLEVDFTTINPSISSRCDWVVVEAQERPMEPSRVQARIDPEKREIHLELDNVARFALELETLAEEKEGEGPRLSVGEPLTLLADGERVPVAFHLATERIVLARRNGRWVPADYIPRPSKSPARAGPFKDAFRNRMIFVFATGGTQAENDWSFQKARFDQETWRYRGNGAVDLVADRDFDPASFADRGVVLYGNRDTNLAWPRVMESDAFDLRRGVVRIGDKELEGDQHALLAIYPRKDSRLAAVAVVGGTGEVGNRVTDFLPYFVSGVGYPDWIVFGPEFLEEGLSGIRGSGYFRPDWTPGESAWR